MSVDAPYADLGLPDADKLKIKTGLVIEIRKAMHRLEPTQADPAIAGFPSTSYVVNPDQGNQNRYVLLSKKCCC